MHNARFFPRYVSDCVRCVNVTTGFCGISRFYLFYFFIFALTPLIVGETVEIETKKHMFSEPWEDSDIILVVEEQKLHVHRLILSMASPVFKAMLSGDFKEKAAAEIPLPGKKADEMTDLLRQIYLQHQGDITSRKGSSDF